MSIGQVLARLRPDFPDISISKLRFLEAEGLVEPERAASGYRKFSATDLERLRYILTAQRDHYLPLRVIREHLEAMERGLEPPAAAGGPPRVPDSVQAEQAAAEETPAEVDGGRAGTPDLRLSADELAANSGLSRARLDELLSFKIVQMLPGTEYFDVDALVVATTVARLAEYGLEPRHVRVFKSAADREVGLIEQVLNPLARQKDPGSDTRAADVAVELEALSLRLHAALVRRGLRNDC
ncbi:MAG: MerR family transcriptional regulator [Propionibacteriales bacterium]|nr:MerR family transcriptional regulator [Propionibacteriales bacterium]